MQSTPTSCQVMYHHIPETQMGQSSRFEDWLGMGIDPLLPFHRCKFLIELYLLYLNLLQFDLNLKRFTVCMIALAKNNKLLIIGILLYYLYLGDLEVWSGMRIQTIKSSRANLCTRTSWLVAFIMSITVSLIILFSADNIDLVGRVWGQLLLILQIGLTRVFVL